MFHPNSSLLIAIKTLLIASVALVLPGCEVIGDIFQAGFWTAVVLIAIVAAIAYFVVRAFK